MAENRHYFRASIVLGFALWTLISLPVGYSQESPAYLRFVSNATDFPEEEYFDYIIVGGGTSGCPLAATLSEHFRVLVLERGGIPYGNPFVTIQDGFLSTLEETDEFTSAAQSFTSADGVPNARGRILGGSSAINAGFYSRADEEFYEASGINWDPITVDQSYDWVEKGIVFRPRLKTWQTSLRDGLLEAGIRPYNGFSLKHKIGTKIGGSTFDRSGRRHSAADLLSYANPSNIKVVVYATVERVLLASSSPRKKYATGVIFGDTMGNFHRAMVKERGEVILCAGSIGSPQLLLLSGIGLTSYLASWGIPVAHHSPYVGRHLYDNPRNAISFLSPFPMDNALIQVVGITGSGSFIEGASNSVPFAVPQRPLSIRPLTSSMHLTVATLMHKITGPFSSGNLRLASTDARANPVVRFNYFSDRRDLERCINGTKWISNVMITNAMRQFKFGPHLGGRTFFRYVGPALPPDDASDAQFAAFCRRTVSTIWHYHGGCLVGKVVDRNLKVRGVNGLRVVDGSTFSISPGTNPQATVLMLGRFIGLKLARERFGWA